ncbi:MAG TPA: hypothetical protein VM120_30050 [Bryobacteraceae bacterium]|nr:hypothetical protein [Bryobacteraceae bacterium]
MPPLPPAPKTVQTIIEPDVALKVEPATHVKLPWLLAWTQTTPLKRPEPKKFIAPGRREVPRAIPMLDAPPALVPPNAQPIVSDLRISLPPVARPALPTPVSGATPIRVYEPKPERSDPARLADHQGEPLNLLSLPIENMKWRDKIEIPASLQLAAAHSGLPDVPAPGASAGSEGERDTNRTSGSGQAVDPKRPGAGDAASSAPSEAKSASNSASLASLNRAGRAASPVGSGNPAEPESNRSRSLAGLVPIRTVHPKNGNFDVVIQSSGSGILPEGAGILSGGPVFTVYLPVGGKRQWILQYCVAESRGQSNSPERHVIRLGSPAVPKAPYPLVSHTLALSLPEHDGKYFLVHGFITVQGSFEILRVVRGGDEKLNTALLATLARWEFRPASRDGVPIKVEILLAVPVERS